MPTHPVTVRAVGSSLVCFIAIFFTSASIQLRALRIRHQKSKDDIIEDDFYFLIVQQRHLAPYQLALLLMTSCDMLSHWQSSTMGKEAIVDGISDSILIPKSRMVTLALLSPARIHCIRRYLEGLSCRLNSQKCSMDITPDVFQPSEVAAIAAADRAYQLWIAEVITILGTVTYLYVDLHSRSKRLNATEGPAYIDRTSSSFSRGLWRQAPLWTNLFVIAVLCSDHDFSLPFAIEILIHLLVDALEDANAITNSYVATVIVLSVYFLYQPTSQPRRFKRLRPAGENRSTSPIPKQYWIDLYRRRHISREQLKRILTEDLSELRSSVKSTASLEEHQASTKECNG